jgi:MOSC domain-containing protein YiiM
VIEGGSITAGDNVVRVRTSKEGMSVASLVALWLDRDASRVAIKRAVAIEALADAWREPLRRRLARLS